MKIMKKLSICFVIIIFALTAIAQEKKENVSAEKPGASSPDANPADVASIDAIIKATYDVISGGKGEQRDWKRFRTLFHPDARLIPTGTSAQTGVTGARAFKPEEYIERSEPVMMQNGFYEREIARRTLVYGNIAHVFSTYEAKNNLSDKKPFLRGINSFQLLNDGKRWWVLTIFWQGETPKNPIPKKFLKSER